MSKQYRECGVKFDSSVEIDQFGMLKARAKIARIGIQTYRDGSGKMIRELRRPEDVAASVDEFKNTVVTLNHPPSFVTADNASEFSKGHTGDARYEDGWLVADIFVTHKDAVEAAMSTHRQFSNGYFAEVLDSPGTWRDDQGIMGIPGKEYEYDAVQTNIVGNHVALVPRARAGNEATFTDSDEIIINHTVNQKNNKVMKIVHNDTVLELEGNDASQVSTLVKELKSSLSEVEGKLDAANASHEENIAAVNAEKAELQGKVDALEAQVEELKNAPKLDNDEIVKQVEERLAVWGQVKGHLDAEPDYSLNALEIKKLYLTDALPNLAEKIEKADEAYINGLWDVKQPEAKSDAEEIEKKLTQPQGAAKADGKEVDQDAELRKAYQEARANYFSKGK